MASNRRRYLVSYDIANAKRLRRVAKTLESYGTRLQFSVFECPLDDLRLAQAKAALAGDNCMIDPAGLRVWLLSATSRSKTWHCHRPVHFRHW